MAARACTCTHRHTLTHTYSSTHLFPIGADRIFEGNFLNLKRSKKRIRQTGAAQWLKDVNTGGCIFVCRSLMKRDFVCVLPVYSDHIICAFTKHPQTSWFFFLLILDLHRQKHPISVHGIFSCTPVTYYAAKCIVETHLIFLKEFLEKDVSSFLPGLAKSQKAVNELCCSCLYLYSLLANQHMFDASQAHRRPTS